MIHAWPRNVTGSLNWLMAASRKIGFQARNDKEALWGLFVFSLTSTWSFAGWRDAWVLALLVHHVGPAHQQRVGLRDVIHVAVGERQFV